MQFKLIAFLLASSALTAVAAPAADAKPEGAVEARAEQWGDFDGFDNWYKKLKARGEQWDWDDFDEFDWDDKKVKRDGQDWDDDWDKKFKRDGKDWDDDWDKKVKRAEQAGQFWGQPQGLTFAGPDPRFRGERRFWGPGGRRLRNNVLFAGGPRCWGGRCW